MKSVIYALALAGVFLGAKVMIAATASVDPIAHSIMEHKHGPNCGHEASVHGDHIDYNDNDRGHALHLNHYDDHGWLTRAAAENDQADKLKLVSEHDHVHGPDCGHVAIKHGDHMDYIHDGELHANHVMGAIRHVDVHGPAPVVEN